MHHESIMLPSASQTFYILYIWRTTEENFEILWLNLANAPAPAAPVCIDSALIDTLYTDYYQYWWPPTFIHDSEQSILVIIINTLSNIKCKLKMFWLQVASLPLSLSTSGVAPNKWQVRWSHKNARKWLSLTTLCSIIGDNPTQQCSASPAQHTETKTHP